MFWMSVPLPSWSLPRTPLDLKGVQCWNLSLLKIKFSKLYFTQNEIFVLLYFIFVALAIMKSVLQEYEPQEKSWIIHNLEKDHLNSLLQLDTFTFNVKNKIYLVTEKFLLISPPTDKRQINNFWLHTTTFLYIGRSWILTILKVHRSEELFHYSIIYLTGVGFLQIEMVSFERNSTI